MSKIKMSFSLILALFLVGILSTAVFANNTYGLSATPDSNGGFTVSFTGANSGDQFTVQLYTSSGTAVGTPVQGTTGSKTNWAGLYTGSVDVTPSSGSSFTPGTVYTAKLYAGTTTTGSVLDTASATILGTNYGSNNSPNTNASPNGSGLVNSNQTGVNNSHKNRSGQSMHGFYQNNSNSCASCHQAHTADPSSSNDALLFKDGVYSTCTACHDGTTGGYNEFAAPTADTVNSVAGTFDIQQQVTVNGVTVNENGSMHQADGSLSISAAPGGGGSQDVSQLSSSDQTLHSAIWGSELDCASCHNPHGGGSTLTTSTGPIKNENNLNEDPLGWGKVEYVANGTPDQQNGKLFTSRTIFDSVPTTETDTYILVRTTAGAVNSNISDDFASNKTNGFLYGAAGITSADTPVIQTYRWNGSSYVPDYSLWLRDTGYERQPFAKSNTVLYQVSGTTKTDITTGDSTGPITVAWQNGFAFGPGVADVTTYDLSVGINVEGTNDDSAAYVDNKDPNYVPYSGTELSLFCASCHTDYLSDGATNDTGIYTTAYRHRTDEDELSCVRCHYAHGTDAQIMKDANDNSYWNLTTGTSPNGATVNTLSASDALQYLADPNPSSALKRYTGMSACYGCHGSGDQFMGDPNTTGDKTTGQGVFGGHVGDAGTSGTPGGSRPTNATRH